jgi:hypothetical protein
LIAFVAEHSSAPMAPDASSVANAVAIRNRRSGGSDRQVRRALAPQISHADRELRGFESRPLQQRNVAGTRGRFSGGAGV